MRTEEGELILEELKKLSLKLKSAGLLKENFDFENEVLNLEDKSQ